MSSTSIDSNSKATSDANAATDGAIAHGEIAKHAKRSRGSNQVQMKYFIKKLWKVAVVAHPQYEEVYKRANDARDAQLAAAADGAEHVKPKDPIRYRMKEEAIEVFEQLVRNLILAIATAIKSRVTGSSSTRGLPPTRVNVALKDVLRDSRLVKRVLERSNAAQLAWKMHAAERKEAEAALGSKSTVAETNADGSKKKKAARPPVRPNDVADLCLRIRRVGAIFAEVSPTYSLNQVALIGLTASVEALVTEAMHAAASVLFQSRIRTLRVDDIQNSIVRDTVLGVLWRNVVFVSRAADVVVRQEVLARLQEGAIRMRKQRKLQAASIKRRKRAELSAEQDGDQDEESDVEVRPPPPVKKPKLTSSVKSPAFVSSTKKPKSASSSKVPRTA